MNKLEIQEQLINLRQQLADVIAVGEAEKRELSEDETSKLASIKAEIAEAEERLNAIDEENKIIANKENKSNNKMEKEIRLVDIIRDIANGTPVNEDYRSMVNGNKITLRADIVAGVDANGGYNVPEDKAPLDVAIRNASVLNKMGAAWMSNLVGDVSIPHYSGTQCGWAGEISAATDGAGTFSEVVLSPKRLTAYLDISKTFLAQDSNDAENILINDLAAAVAEKLDKTIFGDTTGSTQPSGLFADSGVTTGTSLSAATYQDVLDLELKVEEKNGQNFIFITSPNVKYAFRGQDRASGYGQMVFEGNELDGRTAIVSNSVKKGGLIAMDPRDLAVGTWSGVEITVDTVSRAIYNEVRIVVNYLVDAKLRGDRIALAYFD